ncbi:MAG: lipoate--protein ligase [Bacteroidales bacterium]|jgi:lipoate-protein ligase A|nr:lipoate--protein ligase [Bacteroidales bacterium]MCK9498774.1 lipoate--protein ligase [Bacteroidales bacterium]MDY0314312.1 lipoate--protein ligase [Bacteroidales bacterium]NLB85903.1 lipoate--protein ligase [Bacteroidales bacterium]
MYILKSENTNPFFNIALEEYLLKNYEEDFFIVAVNEPSIIVGVNQNTNEVINALYVKMNDLKVVRRLSGGGAVFQDEGNLDFSNIYTDDSATLIDFTKLTELIIEFLKTKFNIQASFSGRNDLIIEGKKISGQARARFGDKILNHGTLLLSSNKKSLADALKLNNEKHTDKNLKSNLDRVTNINDHIDNAISMDKFIDLFLNFVQTKFPKAQKFSLSNQDINAVNELVATKYSVWDWNYGNLPEYNFNTSLNAKTGYLSTYLNIIDNEIKNIKIYGDFFSQLKIADVENALTGIKFNKLEIEKALVNLDFNCYMEGIEKHEFILHLFEK